MKVLLKYIKLVFSFEATQRPLSKQWDRKLNSLLDAFEAGEITVKERWGYILFDCGDKEYFAWYGNDDIVHYSGGEYGGTAMPQDDNEYPLPVDRKLASKELRVNRWTKARFIVMAEEFLRIEKMKAKEREQEKLDSLFS